MFRLPRADGDNVRLAVTAVVVTVFALSLGDALVKGVSAGFPLWQIFVLRSVIAIPVVYLFMRTQYPEVPLLPRRLGWTALRSLMLTLMWVAYYTALPHVPLSLAAAAYYTLPIFIALFAAWFIGDRVGGAGWVAVLLGFVGILLILKPQADDFNPYALLPVVSAVLYALAMILTRTRCRDEHPLVLSLSLNVSFVAVGSLATLLIVAWGPSVSQIENSPFLLGQWTVMTGGEWGVMCVLSIAVIVGSVGAAIAYQSGPSSIVATFDFAYVAFAAAWGFLFFAEVPDPGALLGIALIVGGGVLAVRR